MQALIELFDLNLLASLGLFIWLASILYSSFMAIWIFKRIDSEDVREAVYLMLLIFILYLAGQLIDILSVLGHGGFKHGFSLHLGKEGGSWAYACFGLANITAAFSANHIITILKKQR